MKNKVIQGQVIPINQSNIDTDVIIPKQYLKSIGKTGFGKFLFEIFIPLLSLIHFSGYAFNSLDDDPCKIIFKFKSSKKLYFFPVIQ